ncbi:toxin-antitoxin system YwqK family antitoxin [Candidatus Riflebacteria bacterium]
MKLQSFPLFTFFFILLSPPAFSQSMGETLKKIVAEKSQIRLDRLIYEVNQEKPFTGLLIKKSDAGKIQERRTVKDGKYNSEQFFYRPNGSLLKKEFFTEGKLLAREWFEIDLAKLKTKDGIRFVKRASLPFSGTAISRFKSGQIEECQTYKAGKLHGKNTKWYRNGNKSHEVNYLDGKLHGAFTEWYKNGNLRIEANYVNGVLEGISMAYHPNGQIAYQATMKNGIAEGIVKEWHKSGDIKIEILFAKGKQPEIRQRNDEFSYMRLRPGGIYHRLADKLPYTGKVFKHHKSGYPEFIFSVKDGKLHGFYDEYYDNGKKKARLFYKDGHLVREKCISWNRNGQQTPIAKAFKEKCHANIRLLMDAVELYNMNIPIMMKKLDIKKLKKSRYLLRIPTCLAGGEYSETNDLDGSGTVKCSFHDNIPGSSDD